MRNLKNFWNLKAAILEIPLFIQSNMILKDGYTGSFYNV